MAERRVPESLLEPDVAVLWELVRQRIDTGRAERVGSVRRPEMSARGQRVVRSLLGQGFRARISLDVLERELVARGVGGNLDEALERLGFPPSAEKLQRRLDAANRRSVIAALGERVASWRFEWAESWAEDLAATGQLAGLVPAEVDALADDVARVVDLLTTQPAQRSRVDVAAQQLGSAHALDPGERRAAWIERALLHHFGAPADGSDVWALAGVVDDQVSGPALVWALDLIGDAPAVDLVAAGNARQVPVHLSKLSLGGQLSCPPGQKVLVVENPRVVEYGAEVAHPGALVAANGNPSRAVQLLIQALVEAGAELTYHGDFDAAGLAMCTRMQRRGCRPIRMDRTDYELAVAQAARRGVRLESDEHRCGPTPWDPELEAVFNHHRLIVHEEFVLDHTLGRGGG